MAGGGILQCTQYIPQCLWECGGHEFCSAFKILPLKGYDGIVGMDWLSTHSPQIVNWGQKWLAFQHKGNWVCLQGNTPSEFSCAVVELQLLSESNEPDKEIPKEVQLLIDKFAVVFEEPTGLPPNRGVTHSIPLLPGARPVHIRPY